MRKIIRSIIITASLAVSTVLGLGAYVSSSAPEVLRVERGEQPSISIGVNTDICLDEESSAVSNAGRVSYDASVRLFGVIPVKSVKVEVVEGTSVGLVGRPFGVKLYTRGALIVGTESISTEHGSIDPGKEAGLKKGDLITKINDSPISSIADVTRAVTSSNGERLRLRVENSSGEVRTVILCPVLSTFDNSYKAGLWVRASSAGIGTLTYTRDGRFAGLGHGICDVDTDEIMPLGSGEAVDVNLSGVLKGVSGLPGELCGSFGSHTIGELEKNSSCGVFGFLSEGAEIESLEYEVAMKQHVRTGKAQLLLTLPGHSQPELYDILIEKINYSSDNPTKNMIIEVTDSRLIDAAGGIVQGMSGSPIIQSGKFVAAATHVFVSHPTKGYAIFAEKMLYNDTDLR